MCPHCGGVNVQDALFCEECGYDFTTGTPPMGSEPESAEPDRVQDQPNTVDDAPAAEVESGEADGEGPEVGPDEAEADRVQDQPNTVDDAHGAEVDGQPDAEVDSGGAGVDSGNDPQDEVAEVDSGNDLQDEVAEVEPGEADGEGPEAGPDEAEADRVQHQPNGVDDAHGVGAGQEQGADENAPEVSAPEVSAPENSSAEVSAPEVSGPEVSAPARGKARHTPPSRALSRTWVVEMWVDPDWYAVQQTEEACPSAGVPDIVPLTRSNALIGRPSGSLGVRPEVDAGSDSAVSRRHAQLTSDGQRWWIEDLGSSNGTFVGTVGEPLPTTPLTPGQRVELDRDDRVYVGAWTRLVLRPATASEEQGQG